jgi:hypothetical protein
MAEHLIDVMLDSLKAVSDRLSARLSPIEMTVSALLPRVRTLEERAPMPGPPGERGVTGERGLPGLVGEKGSQGERGAQGERGEKGVTGDPGVRGEPGLRGEAGAKGERGEVGPIGPAGTKGLDGAPGLNGRMAPRTAGPPGPPGERGLPGSDAPLALRLAIRLIALEAREAEMVTDEEIAAGLAAPVRRDLIGGLPQPPKMQKRIVRDHTGKLERVIEEPIEAD